jgi:penicillin-binding protein 2
MGRERLAKAAGLLENLRQPDDDELYEHYRHRRWLPFYLSSLITPEEKEELEPKLQSQQVATKGDAGLILHPVYARIYPEKKLAAHIIGYTGSVGELPTGPINFSEPLWKMREGRSGLEYKFDKELQGVPGSWQLLFDSDGRKLRDEQTRRPVPGGTVVTTLDLDWQKSAERILGERCKRGAFVLIDVHSGEVLVMASRPSFDLNMFIPGISEDDYQALREDPARPLFGRAFQGGYPPASAFKPVVALAALNNGTITEYTSINCPAYVEYGRHKLWNWSRSAYGHLRVIPAIKHSNNPWFAQVGNKVGWGEFLGLARRLGFGSRTGLPLMGETPGIVPNDEWMMENEGRRILNGDTANMSIGQGSLLASPLQVAQLMAGIANGGALPKLQLVRQVHDRRGRVIYATAPERRNWLGLNPDVVQVVHKGMYEVVNAGGTGSRGRISYAKLCAKTGTAQWGPKAKQQRLAWFAGFMPYDTPRYAFAALYEGSPGQRISGGSYSGPIVSAFFNAVKSDIQEAIKPPPKAVVIVDPDAVEGEVLRAVPVEDPGRIGVREEGEEPPPEGILRAIPVEIEEALPGLDEDLMRDEIKELEIEPAEEEPAVPRAMPVDPLLLE